MSQDAQSTPSSPKPEILAPAGDPNSFLAALSAHADAVYLGLKNFSARMEADNFSLQEVSALTALARSEGVAVYITINTMVKEAELSQCYRLIKRLETQTHCSGLIVQDLCMLDLARQAGFSGKLVLSTLANVTHPEALAMAKACGASRVVLPRELSIDEIRILGEHCPEGLELELFVHGALCYCVSGRCYWSSYLGGKSGLRGRCVQPCRRLYQTNPKLSLNDKERKKGKNEQARYFSCQDLSLDVLAKTLLSIPHLTSWKIEGRKKGPHYVFHTVTAYRMLRDTPNDSKVKHMAEEILAMALGRPTTRARFLPQKERIPTDPSGCTSSGLLVGKIQTAGGRAALKPFIPLLAKDYLRIGSEDERWHTTVALTSSVPKGGTYVLKLAHRPTPPAGAPVFLLDRRERELQSVLAEYQQKLSHFEPVPTSPVLEEPRLPTRVFAKRRADMTVLASLPKGPENRTGSSTMLALWLTSKTSTVSRPVARRVYWWLPPVIWPDEEQKLRSTLKHLWLSGARHYVLNAPWQRGFFPKELSAGADLVAGPFCNLANSCALSACAKMGFRAAFVSPELPREDLLALPKHSPLPLGLVLSGFWPVGISRFGLLGLKPNHPFASPKGEVFWARQYGQNTWIYPSWPLNLEEKQSELQAHGYSFFARFREWEPEGLARPTRPGLFNYEGALL